MRYVLLMLVLLATLVGMTVVPEPGPVAALEPTTNLDISVGTYLGGSDTDTTSTVDIAPDGTVVFGGVLPGHNPGGVAPTALFGGGDGVVVRFSSSGQSVLSVTRPGAAVNDLEVDASGRILVCGDFGVALLNADASAEIWRVNPGTGQRCAVGTDGTAAILSGGSVFVHDAGGNQLGTWEAGSGTKNDIALDATNELVFVTGFVQAAGDLQVPFIRAWSYDGTAAWASYDFSASAAKAEGLTGDTRGVSIAMGRDGKLYMAGTINGGTGVSTFSRDPKDVTQTLGDREVKEPDFYHNSSNMGGGSIGWYGRFTPTTGDLELGQTVLTRKTSDEKGNSISPKTIMADEDGMLFVAGGTACCLPQRDQLQIAGTSVGDYDSSEAFLLVMSSNLRQRLVWTPFTAPGASGGDSPAEGVSVRDGVAAVVITLKPEGDKTRQLITHNALQEQTSTLPDTYLAVWRFAESSVPEVSVSAGNDQTVFVGEEVTLQGTATGAENIAWEQTAGPAVELSASNELMSTFTAPAEAGTLTFRLTGTAGDASDNDTVDVVVRAISVDAGEDQKTAFGEEVTLQGSGEGIVSYRWQQVPETTVELSTPNQQQTRFTAPMTSTTLTFELVGIGNGGLETTDTVAVNVKALVVDAGEEQTVEPGEEVTLQGSAPGAESYEWVQLSGPTVELSPTDTLTTSFTIPADADEPLVFQFMARGPGGEEDTDLVRVVVGTQTRLYLPLLSR